MRVAAAQTAVPFSARRALAETAPLEIKYNLDIPPASLKAIRKAARATGVDERLLLIYAKVESNFDPDARAGSYKGLFQLSDQLFRKNGGTGSIYDPEQNAMAAARLLQSMRQQPGFPRDASSSEQALYLYLMHQQGPSGARAHFGDPDGVAWQNIRRYYRSSNIAKSAVTGNVSKAYLRLVGTNMTSAQFIQYWRARLQQVDRNLGGRAA